MRLWLLFVGLLAVLSPTLASLRSAPWELDIFYRTYRHQLVTLGPSSLTLFTGLKTHPAPVQDFLIHIGSEPKYLVAGEANGIFADPYNPTMKEWEVLVNKKAPNSQTPIWDGRYLANKIIPEIEGALNHAKLMDVLADKLSRLRSVLVLTPEALRTKIELEERIVSSWRGAIQARLEDVDRGTRKQLNKSELLQRFNIEVKTSLKPGGMEATVSFRPMLGDVRAKEVGFQEIYTTVKVLMKYRGEDGKGGKHLDAVRSLQRSRSKIKAPDDGC